MFRNVPACSGMFHVPGFIDGRLRIPHRLTEFYKQAPSCETHNIKLSFIRFLDFRFIKINNRIEAIEMKYLSHTLVIVQHTRCDHNFPPLTQTESRTFTRSPET